MKLLKCLPLIIFFILTWGCSTGEAKFKTFSSDYDFEPNGTILAYKDTSKTPNRFVILMTWLVLDINRDFSEYSGVQLERLKTEFEKQDALALIFDDVSKFTENKHYALNETLWAYFNFRPDDFSENPRKLKCNQNISVTIDTVDDQKVTGHLEFWLQNMNKEDSNPVKVTATFTAPMVDEARAKANLKMLIADTEIKNIIPGL